MVASSNARYKSTNSVTSDFNMYLCTVDSGNSELGFVTNFVY